MSYAGKSCFGKCYNQPNGKKLYEAGAALYPFINSMKFHLAPLKKTQGAKYRQITAHLRNLINKGELKPGTRLPATNVLAKECGTN
ncbi:MAG: GntR family transcriptional regulator, partial [Chthoniobacteraceae bacterium]